MAVFTDAFPGGDAVTLGANYDAGYTGCDALQIVSNAVRSITLGTQGTQTVNASGITLGADQYAQLVIAGSSYGSSGQRNDIIILLRAGAGPANTWYEFTAGKNTGSFTSRIVYRVAGTATVLTSESATTWGVGDVLYGQAIGTALVLKRNGSTLLSTTDSNLSSGRAGLSINVQIAADNVAEAVVDSFEAGDLITVSRSFQPHTYPPRLVKPGNAR